MTANENLVLDFLRMLEQRKSANEPIIGRDSINEMFRNEFSQAKMVCIVENIFEDGYWDKLSFLRQHNLPLPTK